VAKTLSYTKRVLAGYLRVPWDLRCPYCGSRSLGAGHKHVLLWLRTCLECGLKFRFPKDDPVSAKVFYERGYVEPTATDLPTEKELKEMMSRAFRGSKFEKSDKVEFIKRVVPPDARVLDYGASWGYLMTQLRAAGYRDLWGYELSESRARFARAHLGEQVMSDVEDIRSRVPFDAIVTSHVLEHLAAPREAFRCFSEFLEQNGKLIIWLPNASRQALFRFGGSWAELVGEPHPLAYDYDCLHRILPRHRFAVRHEGNAEDQDLHLVAEKV
jgi:SAM-dependent methyltransferase